MASKISIIKIYWGPLRSNMLSYFFHVQRTMTIAYCLCRVLLFQQTEKAYVNTSKMNDINLKTRSL